MEGGLVQNELLQGTHLLLPTPTALSLKRGSRPSGAHCPASGHSESPFCGSHADRASVNRLEAGVPLFREHSSERLPSGRAQLEASLPHKVCKVQSSLQGSVRGPFEVLARETRSGSKRTQLRETRQVEWRPASPQHKVFTQQLRDPSKLSNSCQPLGTLSHTRMMPRAHRHTAKAAS